MSQQWAANDLALTAKNLRLPIGLVLDTVEISVQQTNITSDPLQIQLEKAGTAEITVSASSVAAFLEHLKPGGLSGFSVKIEDGIVHIQAVMQVIISIPVAATCSLSIADETQLVLELLDVSPAAGRQILEAQLANINPLFDVSQLPISVALTEVKAENGAIYLAGDLRPPDHLS